MDVHKLKKKEVEFLAEGIEEQKEEIVGVSAISWDGRNLIVRIPKEIADYLQLNETNRFQKNLQFKIEADLNDAVKKTFDVIERTEPKKQNGKPSRKNK